MSDTTTAPCIRGCALLDRHLDECADQDCPGCLPRRAEHGLLCHPCHRRLREMVTTIHVQWALLLAVAGRSTEHVLTAETEAKTHQPPRTSSDGRHPNGLFAVPLPSASGSEPVRIAAFDAADELANWLSTIVELVVDKHALRGPSKVVHVDNRGDDRRLVWRPVAEDGASSDFEKLVRLGHGLDAQWGQWRYIDPPAEFRVPSAAAFLCAWLDRFEAIEVVGDEMETLGALLSRSHALAPWREQATRVPGIPCPGCGRLSLMRFGGSEDVQCTTPRCREVVSPSRYAIWTRMLVEERGAG